MGVWGLGWGFRGYVPRSPDPQWKQGDKTSTRMATPLCGLGHIADGTGHFWRLDGHKL